jgi:hypothetical protein
MNRIGRARPVSGLEWRPSRAGLTRTRDQRRLASASKIVRHGRTRGAAGVGLPIMFMSPLYFLPGIQLVELLDNSSSADRRRLSTTTIGNSYWSICWPERYTEDPSMQRRKRLMRTWPREKAVQVFLPESLTQPTCMYAAAAPQLSYPVALSSPQPHLQRTGAFATAAASGGPPRPVPPLPCRWKQWSFTVGHWTGKFSQHLLYFTETHARLNSWIEFILIIII